MLDLIIPTLEIIKALSSTAKRSYEEKRTYEDKLEKASGIDIYKYVLLINVTALEGYVAQARLQAQQSFALSKFVAMAGFLIVAISIALSIYLTVVGNQSLNAAYLAAIAGVLTEFTAGVFFFLYSKTLTQINLFHDKLVDMQKTSLTHIAESRSLAKAIAGTNTDQMSLAVATKPTDAVVTPDPAIASDAHVLKSAA